MRPYKLVRLVRTSTSEVYQVWEGANRTAQVDIHYAEGLVHATVVIEQDLNRDQIEQLVTQLDEDVVSSYLPDVEREDFVATVYRGDELLLYTDSDDGDDEDDEEANDD